MLITQGLMGERGGKVGRGHVGSLSPRADGERGGKVGQEKERVPCPLCWAPRAASLVSVLYVGVK